MKRQFTIPAIAAFALVVAIVHADVKTKEKTLMKFGGGMMGALMNRAVGDAAKDGIINTVAVKGSRKSSINDSTGQIIDLGEQKIYDLDVKKKEYKVTTFAEMRQRIKDAEEKAAKQAKDAPPEDKDLQEAGKQIEFEFDVKETGQTKQIAGYNAKEVILTVTMHEKDKKLEDSGGMVMKSDVWLGPKIPALDEIAAFDMKYYKAIYGDSIGLDPQAMATMLAMYPSMAKMGARLQTEGQKMQGTPLLTVTTFDSVKSAEQMKAGASQPATGGGIGGMLASRIAKKGPPEARSTLMTTTLERLSIETSASAEDVAVPTAFKEKK